MVSPMFNFSRFFPVLQAAVFVLGTAAVASAQPGAPQNLSATVSGSNVTLTWSPPAGGGAAGYVVEASLTPGGPVIASLSVAGTTLFVPAVPTGTYYVRVRAANGLATSNEITVAVGTSGCPAPPLPPALRVRSAGLLATVSWGSGGGCAPTSYTLFAGSAPGLSDIAVVNAGGQLGLSATAPAGTYFVRVLGTNAFGSAVSQELTLRVAPNAESDTLNPSEAVRLARQMLRSGTYQAAMTWADPTINLDLYLATPGCPAFPPTSCTLASSTSTNTNSETVTQGVTAGQNLELWVANFSNRTTTFTIFSTIDGAAALSAPASEPTATSATPPPQDE
jgi:hypothetical protein